MGDCVGWMLAYLFLTFVAILFFEPGLTPPGFTGRGFFAMAIPIAGAWHLGRRGGSPALYLAFGCLAAVLLVPSYFDNRRGSSIGLGHETIPGILCRWCAFVAVVGLVTRYVAGLRRRRCKMHWMRDGRRADG